MSCSSDSSGETHEHTWVADGSSFLETVERCDCTYKENRHQYKHDERCSKRKVRFRRYTCHCGEMKKVKYNG